jgi:hypothetical protein
MNALETFQEYDVQVHSLGLVISEKQNSIDNLAIQHVNQLAMVSASLRIDNDELASLRIDHDNLSRRHQSTLLRYVEANSKAGTLDTMFRVSLIVIKHQAEVIEVSYI